MELVHTITSDKLKLDGAWYPGPDSNTTAILLLHGVGGNFYSSSLLDRFAAALTQLDLSVLRANTRGHDLVSLAQVNGRFRWEGAAFETVSRCTRDIAAWLAFLREHNLRRLIVLGHSLGALKAIYAAADDPAATPDAIVALSPPRLSYAAFMNGPEREIFSQTIERARKLVQQGQMTDLMTVKTPFPLLITASAYLDKYGPQENYNIERFAARVRCSTLYVYGQLELETGGTAFADIIESLEQLPHVAAQPDFATIPGADHFYTERHGEVVAEVLQWLSRHILDISEHP